MHGGKHMTLPSRKQLRGASGQGIETIYVPDDIPAPMAVVSSARVYDSDSQVLALRRERSKAKSASRDRGKPPATEVDEDEDEDEDHESDDSSDGGEDGASTHSSADSTSSPPEPESSRPSPRTSEDDRANRPVRPRLSNCVFVGALNYSTTERHLAHAFGGPKCVASVRMPRGRKGQRRGIGFVELQSAKLAKAALLKHGMLLMGRRINVREARPDADAESLQEAKQGRLAVARGAALHVRPPGCRAVFVGNLAWQDEDRLRRHFGVCGNVTAIHFDVDPGTGEFKRSARVSFASCHAVLAAIKLHGSFVAGMPHKPIRVTYAVSGVDISQARKRDRRRRPAPVFRLPAASPPPAPARPASSATGRKASSAASKPGAALPSSDNGSAKAQASGVDDGAASTPAADKAKDKARKARTGSARKFVKRQMRREAANPPQLDAIHPPQREARPTSAHATTRAEPKSRGKSLSLRLQGGGETASRLLLDTGCERRRLAHEPGCVARLWPLSPGWCARLGTGTPPRCLPAAGQLQGRAGERGVAEAMRLKGGGREWDTDEDDEVDGWSGGAGTEAADAASSRKRERTRDSTGPAREAGAGAGAGGGKDEMDGEAKRRREGPAVPEGVGEDAEGESESVMYFSSDANIEQIREVDGLSVGIVGMRV